MYLQKVIRKKTRKNNHFLLAVILVILHANQCCGSKSVGSMSFSFWASRIRILPSSSKNRKKNVDSTVLWLLYDFLSSKTDVNVPSNSKKQENFRIRFSVVRIRGSGSVSKCHGSGKQTWNHKPTSFIQRVSLYERCWFPECQMVYFVCKRLLRKRVFTLEIAT
jgi:hypothetical protein